ncbi:MAG: S9 family peptidase, partial [Anaerolineae bacterium]|nr:S9 family peptidase [Anaerolineae bacterium]
MTYPISRYLDVRQSYFPSIRSDGRRVAFLYNMTGVPQVWQVPLSGSVDEPLWPEQVTFEHERVMGVWFSPAPGDGRSIYTRDVGGNEKAQIFVLPSDGSPERCLTADYETAMHIFGAWSGDGERILFAANRRHPGLFDLYVQPLDGEARLVWQNESPGYLHNQVFSPDGRRAAITRMASSFSHELFEIDLETGTARQYLASGDAVRFGACYYAADGQSLYLTTDRDADFIYVARLDLRSGELEPIVVPDWDCECLALAPDGKALAFAINVDGTHEIRLFDLDTGTMRKAPAVGDAPGLVADGFFVFSSDATQLVFSFTSATRTIDVFVWDLVRDRVCAVTRSSHGGVPISSFVAPELVRYPTFDQDATGKKRHIPAWFYKPVIDSDRPLPVVVMVHGGPEGQFRPGFHFLIQYFLHHGYAVFAPNVRGSTGYGKAYSHLDDVEKRMDSVADLAHAAHWLKAQPGIDGERLVVYGGSYGGFMVLSAVTTYPALWAAGVDIVGISNLATFLENTSDYRRGHREAEYGSLARDRAFLERIAPIHHVDRITAPLIVIHG